MSEVRANYPITLKSRHGNRERRYSVEVGGGGDRIPLLEDTQPRVPLVNSMELQLRYLLGQEDCHLSRGHYFKWSTLLLPVKAVSHSPRLDFS